MEECDRGVIERIHRLHVDDVDDSVHSVEGNLNCNPMPAGVDNHRQLSLTAAKDSIKVGVEVIRAHSNRALEAPKRGHVGL